VNKCKLSFNESGVRLTGIWHEIVNQADIDFLNKSYGGFHDSCITELNYLSGGYVNENLSMGFGDAPDRKVSVILKRQWKPTKLELLFEGMRRMNIAGWQNNSYCEIFACYLKLQNDLIKGRDDNLVVWADDMSFDPKGAFDRKILEEPMVTYIISESLRWRLFED
jgi:hypothetical protein